MIRQPIIPTGVMLALLLVILIPLWIGVIRKKGLRRHIPHAVLVTGILICLFLINSRPMVEERKSDAEAKNVDVLFVIDDTMSMYAEDGPGGKSRMDGAREICRKVIQDLDGANFAVIKFNNNSQIMAPFTQDEDSVIDAIDAIEAPSPGYARGTSLNTPHDDMLKLLESSAKKKDRMAAVYYLSDGEITDGSDLRDFSDLAPYIDNGVVIGLGSSDGARVPQTDGGYAWDYDTGDYAVSKMDETTLNSLASSLGVDYVHAVGTESVSYINQDILRTAETAIESSDKFVVYNDRYYIYTGPMLILLAVELFFVIFGDRLLWQRK